MKLPQIDPRTKEDLIRYMKKYLSSYTPEWRFDEENMDVGTALALIYADMMSDTIYRFNQVSEKNRGMFFRMTGANLLPAVPANGYVTFSLVNQEMEGVAVRHGEAVLADTPSQGTVTFETQNDVYVTAARPDCLYLCSGSADRISLLAQSGEGEDLPPCLLFDPDAENLQEHLMYFSHPTVFALSSEAWVYCTFFTDTRRKLPRELLQEFLDEDNVVFEYYSEDGYVPFEGRKAVSGQIALRKAAKQPAFALHERDGINSYWIRCRVKDVRPFSEFSMGTMRLRSSVRKVSPDGVNSGGVDQKIREFFPFGERASLYDEVYFLSDEVFGKRGARITVEFDLDFLKLPLEVQEEETEINWRAIMKRSEIKADLEYDISIAEVIWEYFNGEGYARLFPDEQYADVFGIEDGAGYRRVTMHFSCPEDMEQALVSSSASCCIRARILKMNNLYKTKGNYISPLISNLKLSYDYAQEGRIPEYFSAVNDLDAETFPSYGLRADGLSFRPLAGRDEKAPAMYLGFVRPPLFGPVKMLFSLEENLQTPMPRLNFEYSTDRGWSNLNVVDETEDFRKTGLVTMMGNPDFSVKKMFGKERYWIRITDVNREYETPSGRRFVQKLNGLYMNTTEVSAVETMEPELFAVLPNEENLECRLRYGQICKIRVWVNEAGAIRAEEIAGIEKDHAVEYEYAPDGEVEAIWVEWNEVDQFDADLPDRRCFRADRIEGIVFFGDGKNGRIPVSAEEATIRIEYSTGGGDAGNLPVHSIRRMNRTIGFISETDNHEITAGGCAQEQASEALARNAAALAHGYRAVTVSDYEALAREAARNILSVRCFSNRNASGQQEYGHVTLVVLTKDYKNGSKYFDAVRSQIMDYMKGKMSSHLSGQGRFHIVEPDFLELSVSVSVTVSEYNQVFDVRRDILKRLADFLDPASGNYRQKGWEIGTIPNETQIMNALKDVRGIQLIEGVRISASRRGTGQRTETDLEKAAGNPYALPVGGVHEVIVKVKS